MSISVVGALRDNLSEPATVVQRVYRVVHGVTRIGKMLRRYFAGSTRYV
jgi:hypothetical protein